MSMRFEFHGEDLRFRSPVRKIAEDLDVWGLYDTGATWCARIELWSDSNGPRYCEHARDLHGVDGSDLAALVVTSGQGNDPSAALCDWHELSDVVPSSECFHCTGEQLAIPEHPEGGPLSVLCAILNNTADIATASTCSPPGAERDLRPRARSRGRQVR